MATNYNARGVHDGIVVNLDPFSEKCERSGLSIINMDTWVAGETGSATGYTQNGDTTENRRILDTTPFGYTDVVWDTPLSSTDSSSDGGWNTSSFRIDNTKMYRYSVWIRRKTIVTPDPGSVYLGLEGLDNNQTDVGVFVRSSGSSSTNPYFYSSSSWLAAAGEWLLFVGHVWPVGSGTGRNHPLTGIYKTDGTCISRSQNDYVWKTNNYYSVHRSYLYYATTTTANQQWYAPRVEVLDGSELSFNQLLKDDARTLYDSSSKNNHLLLSHKPTYDNSALLFDGVNDYGSIATPVVQTSPNLFTICGWIKPNSTSRGKFISPNSAGSDHWIHTESNTLALAITEVAEVNNRSYTIGSAPVGQWTYFAISINNLALKGYINGTKTFDQVETIPIAGWTGSWIIGCRANFTFFYNGNIGLLSVYDRELMEAEVMQNYIATRGRYV